MERNGWTFGNLESKPSSYRSQCKQDTWYGYRTGSGPSSVSTTFHGSGTATLTFGNCYSHRFVDVYFNNQKIATASSNQLMKKTVVTFVNGDKLRIEVAGAIIKLNSLKILCN